MTITPPISQFVPRTASRVLGTAICVCVLLLSSHARAQEGSLRKLYVPANRVADWPQGPWEVMLWRDYQEMLAKRESTEQPSMLERAEYSARLVDGDLVAGRLQWTFSPRRDGEQRFFPWGSMKLAVSSLQWKDTEDRAVWGATRQGETLLLLPRTKKDARLPELIGDWSLAGRKRSQSVEFDVRVPSAAASVLSIETATGIQLSTSAGIVSPPIVKQDCMTWRVNLGGETQATLRAVTAQSSGPTSTLIATRTETEYLLQRDELQMNARFDLELPERGTRRLDFQLPVAAKVYSVTYGGKPVPGWKAYPPAKAAPRTQRVRIEFSDELTGTSRPIRLLALLPIDGSRPIDLPMVSLRRSAIVAGTFRVAARHPLEIHDWQHSDCAQTGIAFAKNGRDALTFQQTGPVPRVTLSAGLPRADAACAICMRLPTATEAALVESYWTAVRGELFTLRYAVPDDWNITTVQSLADPCVSGWQLVENDTQRELVVQLKTALNAEHPVSLNIGGVHLDQNPQMSLPAARPMSGRLAEFVVAGHSDDVRVDDLSERGQRVKWNDAPRFVKDSIAVTNSHSFVRPTERELSIATDPNRGNRLRSVNSIVDLKVNGRQLECTVTLEFVPLTGVREISIHADPRFRKGTWKSNEWDLLVQPNANKLEQFSISLPGETQRTFQITSTLRFPLEAAEELRLPVVRSAGTFRGEVRGLSDERILPGEGVAIDAEIPDRAEYTAMSASVQIQPAATAHPVRAATMTVQSLLDSLQGGGDLHRATIITERGLRSFHFELPAPARLVSVALNGDTVNPVRRGEGWTIVSVEPSEFNEITLDYECPACERGFTQQIQVPLPRSQLEILECRYEFALPADWAIEHEPAGIVLNEPLPQLHWSKRLLGPLGRGPRPGFFNPASQASWTEFADTFPLGGGSRRDEIASNAVHDERAAQHRVVYTARSLGLPPESQVTVVLWAPARSRNTAWIAFVVCAALIACLRIAEFRARRHVGVVIACTCLVVSFVTPPAIALVGGGCFSAVLLVGLLPRSWLFLGRTSWDADAFAEGSTASYRVKSSLAATSLVLFAATGFTAETPPVGADKEVTTPAIFDPDSSDVLIPVSPDGLDGSVPNAVYIRPKVREAWQASRSQNEIAYLIGNVEYQLDSLTPTEAEITANFEVFSLTDTATTAISLPVEIGHLAADRPCLVDGKPRPILPDPAGRGFIVELLRRPGAGPALAEKPNGAPRVAPRPTRYLVQLSLVAEPRLTEDVAEMNWRLPPAGGSQLTIKPSIPANSIAVPNRSGAVAVVNDKLTSVDCGTVESLSIRWNVRGNVVTAPLEYHATARGVVAVSPLYCRWHYQLAFQVDRGVMDSVEILLPPNAWMREVKAGTPTDMVSTEGEGRVVLDFRDPVRERVLVNLTWDTPSQNRNDRTLIPAFNPFPPTMRNVVHQIGVVSSGGLSLEPANTQAVEKRLLELLSENYLAGFESLSGSVSSIPKPEFAWQLDAPTLLAFRTSQAPSQSRTQVAQAVRVRKTQVDWSADLRMETEVAPSYQYQFRLPREVVVESAAVKQGESERLARFHRDGDRLTLFLTDGVEGSQRISLRGRRERAMGEETIAVPLLRSIGADFDANTLDISHATELAVDVDGVEGWNPSNAVSAVARGQKRIGTWDVPENAEAPSLEFNARETEKANLNRASLPDDPKEPSSTNENTSAGGPTVPRFDTEVQLQADDRELGKTVLVWNTAATPDVELSWPDGTRLRSVLVNGLPHVADVSDGKLRLTCRNGIDGADAQVTVYWGRDGSTPSRFGRYGLVIPRPITKEIVDSTLTIYPPAEFRLAAADTALVEPSPAGSSERRTFPGGARYVSSPIAIQETGLRTESPIREIRSFSPVSEPNSPATRPGLTLSWHSVLPPRRNTFWTIHRGAELWVVAVIAVVALAGIVLWLTGAIGQSVVARPAIGFALVGATWWIAGAAGPAGCLLTVAALVVWALRQRTLASRVLEVPSLHRL